jgi:3-oxoacyl-[acyl-carrier protein] reductase
VNIDLSGKTALVTGAAHGFGRAITTALASEGCKVFACDILENELHETAKLAGENCETRLLNVADPNAVKATVADIEAAASTIDILVNNAGGVLGQVGRPIEAISPADWQAIFDVNLTGVFLMSQAVAPGMKRKGGGRIINISSGAGLGITLTGIQAYASAKAGQIGLTRQLAHELGPFGITVNCIAPGFILSNPTTQRQWESYGEQGQRDLVLGIATRRLGHPADIANGVLFFAAERSGWVTGQVIAIDGGSALL